MVGVGRDLCGSSSPFPLTKHGHLQQVAQDLVQAGLEYLQRRRLHNHPGQPAPVLRHPQREEVLPHVQLELPMLQFVPVAPCPVDGHHWKESGPIFLTPTLKILIGINEIPSQPSLLQAKQAQLPQPFLWKVILDIYILQLHATSAAARTLALFCFGLDKRQVPTKTALSLPFLSWTGESKYDERFEGQDQDRER